MRFPTELRIYSDRLEDEDGIFNMKTRVVNIKNLTIKKEDRIMLENEKTFKLEQLNSLKGKYENMLDEIKKQDVDMLVNERLATVREGIEKDVIEKHEAEIAKTEMKLDVINEMIAEVEAVEVEAPVAEMDVTENATDTVDEVPADDTETNI